MLDAPEPDLIWLHEFSQNGPLDLRKAAELDLMSWAVSAANSQRATAAWKVAAAEGRPELYRRWVKVAEQHLTDNHSDVFPFSVGGISHLEPGSGSFLEVAQMKRHIQLRLLAVVNALKAERFVELNTRLRERAEKGNFSVMDPTKDATLEAEFVASEGFAMLARLTNRGRLTITNAAVISAMAVDAPKPTIPAGAVLMRNLDAFTSRLTGIDGVDSDMNEINMLLEQWNWGQDQFSMVFLPELKPREQVTLYVAETTSAQFGLRASLLMFCDQFYLPEMPILGLTDYQKKNVAAMKRRRATWMNGETPSVKAESSHEAEFIKARRSASK
jgi:hypothetical protein